MTLREFFAMDGYALFVWPAYAITMAVLVINVFSARGNHRRALADARRRLRAEEQKR